MRLVLRLGTTGDVELCGIGAPPHLDEKIRE
jgi:hypothetical protein